LVVEVLQRRQGRTPNVQEDQKDHFWGDPSAQSLEALGGHSAENPVKAARTARDQADEKKPVLTVLQGRYTRGRSWKYWRDLAKSRGRSPASGSSRAGRPAALSALKSTKGKSKGKSKDRSKSENVCQLLAKSGTCHIGSSCKYNHEQGSSAKVAPAKAEMEKRRTTKSLAPAVPCIGYALVVASDNDIIQIGVHGSKIKCDTNIEEIEIKVNR
jgi:hypothetical protein